MNILRHQRLYRFLAIVMIFIFFVPVMKVSAATKTYRDMSGHKYEKALSYAVQNGLLTSRTNTINADTAISRGAVLYAVNTLLGATKEYESMDSIRNMKQGDSYYRTVSIALNAGYISRLKNNTVYRPNAKATRSYIASVLSKAFGLDKAKIIGNKNADSKMTRGEFAYILMKNFPNIIGSSTSKIKSGTVVINKPRITISNQMIKGNLVISEGAASSTIRLENVTVTGKVIVRSQKDTVVNVCKDSSIPEIVMKQVSQGTKLEIAEPASVRLVTMEGGKDTVQITGNVDTLNIKGNNLKVETEDGFIQTIQMNGSRSELEVKPSARIQSILVKETASGVSIDIEGSVKSIETNGDNGVITGNGTLTQAKINGNGNAIRTQGTQITVNDMVTDVTVDVNEAPEVTPTIVPAVPPVIMPPVIIPSEPMEIPTEIPTQEPMVAPSEAPTQEPTTAPSVVPTQEPTAIPTATPEPTVTPVPTATPEPTVTSVPTVTPVPTTTPTPEPEDPDSLSISVRGKTFSLGESKSEIIQKFGEPCRTDATEYSYDFMVYNDDYERFMMIAIENDQVVGWYTDSIDFSFCGLTTTSTKDDIGLLYHWDYYDENDNVLSGGEFDASVEYFMDNLEGDTSSNEDNTIDGIWVRTYTTTMDSVTDEALRAWELETFDLTNSFRARNKLSILNWSDDAATAARLHSKDMADNNYFSHTGWDGSTSDQRISAQGIKWHSCGENIAAGYKNAMYASNGWMNSSGHRSNILETSYRNLGVGYALGGYYHYYGTQNFFG